VVSTSPNIIRAGDGTTAPKQSLYIDGNHCYDRRTSSTWEDFMNKIRRLLILLAGLVGLLAIAETAANAGISGVNHCEPLRRSS
jgi:hypothetical protein